MRNERKVLSGTVVSNKMQKTITVEVNYYKKANFYDKKIKKTHKFYVHDQDEIAKIGDKVDFMETRPFSKTKKFRLLNIISSPSTKEKQL
ncbi:30S ribosomal protein S17 [Candidatus Phytoplasma phoenicium]|uniref:Small ribosomal subunit protein uS17 n=1 Tax=Candidatus Phytoplasma phoenicium TaxID=198422 RepID=A0A0L0MK66_9MOLU|nr:30S ribosomal protein S17 [Candidatus Phytoplasma phoenicium]KND62783.1 30S ribosomal protein S17 [Candidatus Phytoplasma phoenicium]